MLNKYKIGDIILCKYVVDHRGFIKESPGFPHKGTVTYTPGDEDNPWLNILIPGMGRSITINIVKCIPYCELAELIYAPVAEKR